MRKISLHRLNRPCLPARDARRIVDSPLVRREFGCVGEIFPISTWCSDHSLAEPYKPDYDSCDLGGDEPEVDLTGTADGWA
jgi:hypothetical protein